MEYWYESCQGAMFSTDSPLTYEDMYCEQCSDSHRYIGRFETEDEAIKELNS